MTIIDNKSIHNITQLSHQQSSESLSIMPPLLGGCIFDIKTILRYDCEGIMKTEKFSALDWDLMTPYQSNVTVSSAPDQVIVR